MRPKPLPPRTRRTRIVKARKGNPLFCLPNYKQSNDDTTTFRMINIHPKRVQLGKTWPKNYH